MLMDGQLPGHRNVLMKSLPLTEVDVGGALAVYVQRLRLTWQVKHDALESCAGVGGRDLHALGVRQRPECVARKQRAQELEGLVALFHADAVAVLVHVVRRERGRRHVGRRDIAFREDGPGRSRERERGDGLERAGRAG